MRVARSPSIIIIWIPHKPRMASRYWIHDKPYCQYYMDRRVHLFAQDDVDVFLGLANPEDVVSLWNKEVLMRLHHSSKAYNCHLESKENLTVKSFKSSSP